MSNAGRTDVTGLLLAAGVSRRFGGPKLLRSLEGKALIQHAWRALSPCDRIVAVVRPGDLALHDLLERAGIKMAVNTEAGEGMGRSIACGVAATRASAGWCILPADMPAVSTATTRLVVRALLGGASLVAPFYRGRRGHPVGFGAVFGDDLTELTGDRGGRTILESNPDLLQRLNVADAGILRDIDTPEQL